MKNRFFNFQVIHGQLAMLPLSALILCSACHKTEVNPQPLRHFNQVNLVANTQQYQPKTVDPTLVNGFGMAWSSSGVAWVNSVGGHVSEIYNADGDIGRPGVKIPSPADTINGLPCGVVFSAGKGFRLLDGTATFIFSGFDGVISAWNPAAGTRAIRLKAPANASFTGLALAQNGSKNLLYAANFRNHSIDVWDTAFSRVSLPFKDPSIPTSFAPYNIQEAGNLLYVLYAEINSNGLPVAGKGKGYVSVFTPDGQWVKTLASGGTLNVPWGITEAPAAFFDNNDLVENGNGLAVKAGYDGSADHRNESTVLLIGNFGDGRINVFTKEGTFLGQLHSNNRPVQIDGLWALSFAPSTAAVDPNRLYFTAGPNHEGDGLFGYVIRQ